MNTEAANASKKGNSGNGGRYKGKPKGKQASTKSYKETFKGECEGLQGKTFYIGSTKQADNYNQTLEAILDYIMREYTNGMDVREALESMEEKDFSVEMPKIMTLDDKATAEEKKSAEKLHDIELKLFVERKDKYRINMVKSYGLIWGQCTKALKNKIEARKGLESRCKQDQNEPNHVVESNQRDYPQSSGTQVHHGEHVQLFEKCVHNETRRQ